MIEHACCGAGLVRADELRKELERVKAKKAAMAGSGDGAAENMGRGAESIRRDRHGRRLGMLDQVSLE